MRIKGAASQRWIPAGERCGLLTHIETANALLGAGQRLEVVIKGTDSEFPDASAEWREYEFKGKPGDVNRRPCVVSPYHWKLDWQMWFTAMSPPEFHPWIFALVERLLEGEKRILSLFAHNPFPDAPPKFIRGRLVSLPRYQARRACLVDAHLCRRISAADDAAPRGK